MKDPFHPYFSNLERYDRFEEISSHDKFIVSIEMYPRPTSRENLGIRCEKVGSTCLVSFEREREDWKKNQEFSYRLAVSRILASVKFTYTQRDALQERRKTEGEGATKLVCALSESESHVERAVCDYTS